MDPETTRLLITAGATLSAAVAGGVVTALGTWLVARANRSTQLEVAQEAARRDRRERRIAPVIDSANRTSERYAWALAGTSGRIGEELRERVSRDLKNDDRGPFEDHGVSVLTTTPQFMTALTTYVQAETALLKATTIIWKADEADVVQAVEDAKRVYYEAYLYALLVLNHAAEDYVDGVGVDSLNRDTTRVVAKVYHDAVEERLSSRQASTAGTDSAGAHG